MGVAVGVCLVVVFVVTTVMALKREASPSWAAASGVVAAVVLGVSVIGCVVAAAQYDDRDQQHRDRYVAAVTEWLSDELGGSFTASDATRLLSGHSITTLINGKSCGLSIEQDRSHRRLHLLVGVCD